MKGRSQLGGQFGLGLALPMHLETPSRKLCPSCHNPGRRWPSDRGPAWLLEEEGEGGGYRGSQSLLSTAPTW